MVNINRFIAGFCLLFLTGAAWAEAKFVQTPYKEQNVVFDFFFDEPAKISSALFWVRSQMNPLIEEPYNLAPDFMNLIILIHGTEIVTLAKKNYPKYKDAVDRMRYYNSLGVKIRVCGLAAEDYGYSAKDFHDFVEKVPSAITELAHWQMEGYAVIAPKVMEKKYTIEEIR